MILGTGDFIPAQPNTVRLRQGRPAVCTSKGRAMQMHAYNVGNVGYPRGNIQTKSHISSKLKIK